MTLRRSLIALFLLAPPFLHCGGSGPAAPTDSPSGAATTSVTSTSTAASTTTTAPPTSTSTVPARRIRRRATFRSANGYQTQGSAQIVEAGGSFTLELLSDFRTNQSAALDVRLCSNTNCRGNQINLGDLQAFGGAQSYELPNAGNAFSHVVIFCRGVALAFGDGVFS